MFIIRYERDSLYDVVDFEGLVYTENTNTSLIKVFNKGCVPMDSDENPLKYINEMTEGEPFVMLPIEFFVEEGHYDD